MHARECGACNQSLTEVLWQQKWLGERFAEVSEQLLAHAPPLWGAAFQERLERTCLARTPFAGGVGGGPSGGRRSGLVDVDNFHD